ncbi:CvpA family protein [Litoribrevibacter euphylliae]|uniref:CvpA family protein n=1 Tax=Litoribrevibacter euphylliae TaxID=1834034 RepID=A0ABV7HBG8_9GAMM
MNWLDIVIISVIAVSALVSLKRGFVKELMSLVTWIAALLIARIYAYDFSHYLSDFANNGKSALVLAFFVLFVGSLIVGSLINFIISQFVHAVGLSLMDRFLGVAFGVVRGALVIVVGIGLMSLTAFSDSPAWQSSVIVPHFAQVEEWTKETTKLLSEQLSEVDMSGLVDPSVAGEVLQQAGDAMSEVPDSIPLPDEAFQDGSEEVIQVEN